MVSHTHSVHTKQRELIINSALVMSHAPVARNTTETGLNRLYCYVDSPPVPPQAGDEAGRAKCASSIIIVTNTVIVNCNTRGILAAERVTLHHEKLPCVT